MAGVFGFVAGSADVSINLMRNMAVRMDHAGPLALGFAWVDREGEFHQENRSGPNALQLQRLRYFYGMPMGLGFMERQEGVIARHRTVSQPIVGDGLALVWVGDRNPEHLHKSLVGKLGDMSLQEAVEKVVKHLPARFLYTIMAMTATEMVYSVSYLPLWRARFGRVEYIGSRSFSHNAVRQKGSKLAHVIEPGGLNGAV